MTAPILRTRPIGVGHLRAFCSVARHLNFRAAADDLSVTQSAVSRQIQGLEAEVGLALFHRHTRAVELTSAGAALLAAVAPSLERMDSAVRHVRATAGRKQISVTTFASFASMWLIPRLEKFQQSAPDVDVRVDGTEALVDLDLSDVDVALRYGPASSMPAHAVRLFGEQLTPVASPWLLGSSPKLKSAADLAQFPLIEAGDAYTSSFVWLSWRRWLDEHGHNKLQPKRWLYFNYAHQMVQAALTGQGVVLARMPLVASALASGELVEPLPKTRIESPMSYWMIASPRALKSALDGQRGQSALIAFCDWVKAEAKATRLAIGEVQDSDQLANAD